MGPPLLGGADDADELWANEGRCFGVGKTHSFLAFITRGVPNLSLPGTVCSPKSYNARGIMASQVMRQYGSAKGG